MSACTPLSNFRGNFLVILQDIMLQLYQCHVCKERLALVSAHALQFCIAKGPSAANLKIPRLHIAPSLV